MTISGELIQIFGILVYFFGVTVVSDTELCFGVFILNQLEEDLSILLSGGPLSGNEYNTGFMRSIINQVND